MRPSCAAMGRRQMVDGLSLAYVTQIENSNEELKLSKVRSSEGLPMGRCSKRKGFQSLQTNVLDEKSTITFTAFISERGHAIRERIDI